MVSKVSMFMMISLPNFKNTSVNCVLIVTVMLLEYSLYAWHIILSPAAVCIIVFPANLVKDPPYRVTSKACVTQHINLYLLLLHCMQK